MSTKRNTTARVANMLITRHASTDRWIICAERDGMIESDEVGARRGDWKTRKEAVAAAREIAEQARLMSL